MRKKIEKFAEAAGKSISVNAITVFFGLLQLFCLFVCTQVSTNDWNFDKIIKDCVILFFCSALVSASIVEYYCMENKHRICNFCELIFIILLPFVLIIVISNIYVISIFNLSIDTKGIKSATYLCLIFSIGYSLVFHTYRFYRTMKVKRSRTKLPKGMAKDGEELKEKEISVRSICHDLGFNPVKKEETT